MKCFNCGTETTKAIYMGAPIRFCTSCTLATGVGALLANWFPVGDRDGEFVLMTYEGRYLPALWHWFMKG